MKRNSTETKLPTIKSKAHTDHFSLDGMRENIRTSGRENCLESLYKRLSVNMCAHVQCDSDGLSL